MIPHDPRERDKFFMLEALNEARRGMREHQQWPIGAVLVYKNEIVARAYNNVLGGPNDWFAHAELQTLHAARPTLRQPMRERLTMTLYTTLEPCTMCFGAAMQSNIGRIVFALEDPEGETLLPPRRGNSTNKRPGYQHPDVQPFILRQESADLLREYTNLRFPTNQQWRIEWPKRLAAQTQQANDGGTLVSFHIMITGQATSDHLTAAAANTGLRGPGTPVCTLCENGTLELVT
jgi:tRNA(Arg) A34 adenosine deaminase TadA